jgi:hypothetical protein
MEVEDEDILGFMKILIIICGTFCDDCVLVSILCPFYGDIMGIYWEIPSLQLTSTLRIAHFKRKRVIHSPAHGRVSVSWGVGS